MNALLGYVYHAQARSLSDYHYTATDIVLAIVLIAPGVLFLVGLLFAGPIQEAIAAWSERHGSAILRFELPSSATIRWVTDHNIAAL